MNQGNRVNVVLVLDRQGIVQRCDLHEADGLIFGDVAVGRPLSETTPESLGQLVGYGVASALAGEGAQVVEWCDTGSEAPSWYEVIIAGIDEGLAIITIRDVTARKTAEREARRQKRMLDSLIDLNPYAIVVWNRDGRLHRCNKSMEKFVGNKVPAEFNMFASPTLPLRGLDPTVEQMFEGRALMQREDWFRPSEFHPSYRDDLRCVEYNVVPVMDDEGSLDCIIVMNNDITERRLAEMEVERQREMLDKIIELNPYAIALWDKGGHFLRANQAWHRLFITGPPAPEYSMLYNNREVAERGIEKLVDRITAGEVVVQPEMWFDPHAFDSRYQSRPSCTRVTFFSIKDAQGTPETYISMYEDITERRKAEMELERLAEERYDQVKAIAGGTAHEIYNALFPAKSLIVTLREKLEASGDGKEERVMRLIQDAINRAIAMTDTVMKYSRLESDKRHEQTSLRAVIEEVIQANLGPSETLGVTWENRVDQNARIRLSRAHAFSLFNNLAVNSLDALTESSSRLISVSSADVAGRLEIRFSDTGSGIAAENLARVFNAFYSTKPRTGTGLGLAMVQRIVQLYDGKIEVESTLGSGTKFTISFPIHDQPLTEI